MTNNYHFTKLCRSRRERKWGRSVHDALGIAQGLNLSSLAPILALLLTLGFEAILCLSRFALRQIVGDTTYFAGLLQIRHTPWKRVGEAFGGEMQLFPSSKLDWRAQANSSAWRIFLAMF